MNNYFYIYVFQSEKDSNFYVGYTNNINRRITEYQNGKVPSTKHRLPLKLVYWEGCLNQNDATKREKYLKTAWGKRYIKNRLKKLSHGVNKILNWVNYDRQNHITL